SSNQAKTASAIDTVSMMPCAVSMILRRSKLSETAPAASEKIITGRVVEAWTSATMSGEVAIEGISQEAPTACIRPPKLDDRLANQTARKIGWRKGRKGELRCGCGVTPAAANSAAATSAMG